MSQRHLSQEDMTPNTSPAAAIDWCEVGRIMLKNSLPINPLSTQPEAKEAGLDQARVSLQWIDPCSNIPLAKQGKSDQPFLSNSPGNRSIIQHYQEEEFWTKLLNNRNHKEKKPRIALLGPAGTGKTLTLQKIAHWILSQTEDLPIWLSPNQWKQAGVEDYIYHQWLAQAATNYHSGKYPLKVWQESFEALLNRGQVWLLLDGIDHITLDHTESGLTSPLSVLADQLQGWTQQSCIVLTCQTQTWEDDLDGLSNFEIYQTQEFADFLGVRRFIQRWFEPKILNLGQQQTSKALGQTLCQVLSQPRIKAIREALTNPLRLALFCRLWQQNPDQLPSTVAQLYGQLVSEFYQWQAEKIQTTPEQQQQLNTALAILALKSYQQDQKRAILTQKTVREILGEDSSLLRLALQLKWLVKTGIFIQDSPENHYRFNDRTFGQYFASLAVEDWQLFLNHHPSRTPSGREVYPIFDRYWWGIILFWLGRADIAPTDKEAFIKALITFDDGCGSENFYGVQAYCLAAAGLSEFKTCSLAEEICQQLIKWEKKGVQGERGSTLESPLGTCAGETLNHLDHPLVVRTLMNLIEHSEDPQEQKQGFRHLVAVGRGNASAIAALTQCLDTTPSPALRWQVAETLGKIDPGNNAAINTFIHLLENANSDQSRQMAFSPLEKIGKQNLPTIKALVQLLHQPTSISLRRRILQCLEVIGQGHATAIAVLVQLIRTTKDIGMRQQVAETLEKIDPGNPTAITILVQLAQETTPETIRREAVYSLGEVCPGNIQAINALVNLLDKTRDIYTQWIVVSSLGKIGSGNQEAIKALEKVIALGEPMLLYKEALESLGKIDPANPMMIEASIKLMERANDEAIHRETAETLGKLDPGNPQAIAALTQLLKISKDNFTRRQAAASLGKIDPGNLDALNTLIQLVQNTEDPDIASLAADSLGEMGLGNPAAIATLIRVVQTNPHLETRRAAVKSLGTMAMGNKSAIAALVQILCWPTEDSLRQQAAESLMGIMSVKQMPWVVTQLGGCLLRESDPPHAPSYRVLWHCAQHLPYGEFYQAWHERSLSSMISQNSGRIGSKTAKVTDARGFTLIYQLQQTLAERSDLGSVYLVAIDSGRFIDPNNPPIDMYDQMLEQACPEFEHGIPETMSKLRLYWNTLQRGRQGRTEGDRPKTRFILLLYTDPNGGTTFSLSSTFLETLSKFQGNIGVITDQVIPSQLTRFSPNDSQLVKTILDWITYSY
ncbi:putative signal transduction protein with Nacht domain [Rippkaea orientalis PCC 8801]|uniref:Putative signal transduction protein with Nacht domain n=1 Tax=Rippkaea orientalis (strain PCC 8801 / RF-1) TaxID=41431 RepID=B7JVS3_RIPO1|nr:HEAT repeat domain-containing protein [Rippkaea orientalis]ACK64644.1 putative signal transduction protein with Nacht domain [Rippkaea orientalis PCC 8801]